MITIQDEFSESVEAYAASRGANYGLERGVNRAARLLASFAMAKVRKADPTSVRARYMAIVKQTDKVRAPAYKKMRLKQRLTARDGEAFGKATGKAAKRYALTYSLAAFLVWKTDYEGGRSARGDAFYSLVNKFIGRRAASCGYHRAGLLPALGTFGRFGTGGVARGAAEKVPRYKHLPGRAIAASANDATPTAYMEDFARGVLEVSPAAFEDSRPEVQRELDRLTNLNLQEGLRRHRLF